MRDHTANRTQWRFKIIGFCERDNYLRWEFSYKDFDNEKTNYLHTKILN